ncbi:MAG: TatD family hydrolase [Clostridiales bacterium]|nr:TatD family hydrolase [Candidatus Cacconaster stercorequi]
MLFDTHAHYDDEAFDADRDALLTAMPQRGVGRIVNPGCTVASSKTAVELAERYDHVYAAVGIHPEECGDFVPAHIDELRTLAQHEKVVAIGEIGLDYHWPENPSHEFQQMVLRSQLRLAQELALPVIIHDRDAHADTLAIVQEYPGLRGVFHCYSGSAEMAREIIAMGWYLGFDGPLTYKNARKAIAVAKEVPPERILIETDSPYLPPVPHRGERNDSTLVSFVCDKLAELRGVTREDMEHITWENACRFFGI